VRTAIDFAPYGWMQGRRTVFMVRQSPTRALIREQIHVKNAFAPAGAQHRRLFLKAIFLHDVQGTRLQLFWQGVLDEDGPIGRRKPEPSASCASRADLSRPGRWRRVRANRSLFCAKHDACGLRGLRYCLRLDTGGFDSGGTTNRAIKAVLAFVIRECDLFYPSID
jgi:hypothetical protein